MTDNSRDASVTALLTLTEAAAVLRTPVATLRYWRHLGIGPAGFRLGRRVLYRRDDLDRWVEDQRTAQAVDPLQS
ncbi:excisionase family DNA binding protein [Geodermatophilus bullaregiensis]|uniref:helix-turn-helix domain-containing protein n=1 Tax=Geodermatophilus bullaregiensis TaxID=1564160 RepID=UPI0019581984|nr:helix-turn-helix domain-containing protein [Geodermatophilus bullaregiensis]MBM7808194.1 excisionase family DNA binding protein [Geodermatophilus bullaregiensis]